ncbi:outer membrane porin [Caballeronia calidae]|uniref:Outer membrane porin n=1 Tax=Caballeronia calidae TaxID=1777139 RepID=A0A158E5Q8_9BURK|nr:outer membrane porin [Caballeronia calidae]
MNKLLITGPATTIAPTGALTLGRQTDDMLDFVAPRSSAGTEYGGTHFAHPFDIDHLNDSFQINHSVKYVSLVFPVDRDARLPLVTPHRFLYSKRMAAGSSSGTTPLNVAWIDGVSVPSATSDQIQATAGTTHRF